MLSAVAHEWDNDKMMAREQSEDIHMSVKNIQQ